MKKIEEAMKIAKNQGKSTGMTGMRTTIVETATEEGNSTITRTEIEIEGTEIVKKEVKGKSTKMIEGMNTTEELRNREETIITGIKEIRNVITSESIIIGMLMREEIGGQGGGMMTQKMIDLKDGLKK